MDSPKLEVRKRKLSINSRLKFNGADIPGVRTVMVTPFEDLDETHLSVILANDAISIVEEPEGEEDELVGVKAK